MKEYLPYTYLIGWSKLDKWYYGSEYSICTKIANPENLWSIYFTSSKIVKEFRAKNGEPDIIEIRKTFKTAEEAVIWEGKVLKKMKASQRIDFLNKCNSEAFGWVKGHNNGMYGKTHTKESREKISKGAIGNTKTKNYTNKFRLENNMKLLTGKPKGTKHSEIAKQERSNKLKGKAVHKNLKRPKGIKHSLQAKNNIRAGAKNRAKNHCDACNRMIDVSNWDRHLLSKKHLSQF